MKKFIPVMAKILEIFFLIFAATMVAFTIMSAVKPELVYSILQAGLDSPEMNVLGFGVYITDNLGNVLKAPMVILFAVSIPVSLCVTMLFRNIYLIFKTAEGKTWFSKGETPFQKDIIRMIRELGGFSIAIPVIQLIGSAIVRLVCSSSVEANVLLTGLIFGLVVFSLSEFFSYGQKLEEEVEGLV